MNIAIDATAILGPLSKNRGIGNYALSQFITLINNDTKNKYFLLNLFEDYSLKNFILNHNYEEFYFYTGRKNFLISDREYKKVFGDIIKNFIKNNNIDVFYITSPFDGYVTTYEKDWFQGVKTIATVYDIIPYVFKNRYLPDKNSLKWYMGCVDMLKWVDNLLVISQSVKDDLIKYLKFNADKIKVIYGAADPEIYKEINVTNEEKANLYNKYKISKDYIMCTGGDDDRKNIKALIIAYSKIGQELIDKYQLVIVCKLSSFAVELYSNVIKEYNVEGKVILTNFVSENELIQLYNLATLMTFPSQYEGFGLPVVEAWMCGTPVLTSNNSSLGEIAGDGAVLVDPFKIEDITRGLVEALTKTDLSKLLDRGKERLKFFTWDRVATLTMDCINDIELELQKRRNVAQEKKKIAFFTPLPPIESGISDFSVDILNELCNFYDIDVYIDEGYTVNCLLPNNVKAINHKKYNSKKAEYFETIYQMGNSFYHTYMYPYVQKVGGIIELHDYNMHNVAEAYTVFKNNNIDNYQKYLLEDFDPQFVDNYIKNYKQGIKIQRLEINGYVTNYVDKVIVHSDDAKYKLLTKNVGKNVKKIHSYAKIDKLITSKTKRKEMNINPDDIIIASFGHIHETKRAIPALKAFARLCEKVNNIKYFYVGKMEASLNDAFYEIIKKYALEDKVLVTGYTELDEFENYIDIADICVNLRYPYNGETSGSLMRLLGKGKSFIVNDIGSFGEIPDNCCVKIPSVDTISSDEEVEYIYNSLYELVYNTDKRKEIEMNARKFAEENLDIKRVIHQYVEFIEDDITLLDESIINQLTQFEVKDKNYSDHEIRMLSKTLAYSIQ